VSVIKPFRALRPVPEKAKLVSCVPYDVVYESEVREFIENNPLSFLRVTRSEAEFPEGVPPAPEAAFERARQNLQKMIEEGLLLREAEPCLYIYRLAAPSHTQTGIVACCSLDEYEQGLIKKHENTRPDKVADRTGHMVAVRAQTGLVFLTFRGTEKLRGLISTAVESAPIYDFPCAGDVQHTIWRIEGTADWVEAFGEVPAVYIADGHHRVESANLARKTLSAQNPDHTGSEEYNYIVAGLFPAEDLQIMAYNRVVKDLQEMNEAEFFARITGYFTVTETHLKIPGNRGEICMYLGGRWYTLAFNFLVAPPLDAIEALDVSILQDYLLGPVLGIDDPRTNDRIGFIGGARGTDELEKCVDQGTAKVAFSMFPTTMDDLLAVSDMGEIMPPKSTWFEPKLKDGLIIHEI
jgi:uncharacterized protein (DUF1015 family)